MSAPRCHAVSPASPAQTDNRSTPVSAQAGRTADAPKSIRMSSAELFGGGNELVIVHHGREYRLRITQNNRLILNA